MPGLFVLQHNKFNAPMDTNLNVKCLKPAQFQLVQVEADTTDIVASLS